MQVSAEIRWYWHNTPPTGLEYWFRDTNTHPCPVGGGGKEMLHVYVHDANQVELGIKKRDTKSGYEVKGLIWEKWDDLNSAPFTGPIEIWCKWSSGTLVLDPSVMNTPINKFRWMRKFSTEGNAPKEIELDQDENPASGFSRPERGCNVEFTKITLQDNDVWWTLGFESFNFKPDATISAIAQDLIEVANVLAGRHPTFSVLAKEFLGNYPKWLAEQK